MSVVPHQAAQRLGDGAHITLPTFVDDEQLEEAFFHLFDAHDFPWRARRGSAFTPEDHAELLESFVTLVEAFELMGDAR